MSVFHDLLQSITDRGRLLSGFTAGMRSPEPVEHAVTLSHRLLSVEGEASGLALAAEILAIYAKLDDEEKRRFFQHLLQDFGPDMERAKQAARAFVSQPDLRSANLLHRESEPARQNLFRRLNQAPGGTHALIEMRSDLLAATSASNQLDLVDQDFRHLFQSWFNRGFLELRRIDWHTPAVILERIIEYEAVHEIGTWEDLRRRIDLPDRRLYAFFHPRISDEPLIFVEVALMEDVPSSIDEILSPERNVLEPKSARTAIFYSISDCQPGLARISFGNFLIKQVVEELRNELAGIATFATLSPVRGFADWVQDIAKTGPDSDAAKVLNMLAEREAADFWNGSGKAAKELLMPLAAFYLTKARDRRGKVPDPVARFHLGNGAQLSRVNWLADTSEAGISSSYGIMVNYAYKLDEIERNHERFVVDGEVSAAAAVRKLAKATDTARLEESMGERINEQQPV